MLDHASLVLTDSGGIQEEAPAFDVHTLVLREVTERPEAVQAGAATLVGTDAARILDEGHGAPVGRREGASGAEPLRRWSCRGANRRHPAGGADRRPPPNPRLGAELKIVVHCVYFPPEVGGLESHVHYLCRGLVKRGHEVTVVTSLSQPGLPPEEDIDGIRVHRTPLPARNWWGWLAHAVGSTPRTRAAVQGADVVHAQAFPSLLRARSRWRAPARRWSAPCTLRTSCASRPTACSLLRWAGSSS